MKRPPQPGSWNNECHNHFNFYSYSFQGFTFEKHLPWCETPKFWVTFCSALGKENEQFLSQRHLRVERPGHFLLGNTSPLKTVFCISPGPGNRETHEGLISMEHTYRIPFVVPPCSYSKQMVQFPSTGSKQPLPASQLLLHKELTCLLCNETQIFNFQVSVFSNWI